MHKQRTPVYFVYGHDEQERIAFFQRFCHAKNPLLVQIAGDMPPEAISFKIVQRLTQNAHDAVWVLWDDDVPMERLLEVLQQTVFSQLCNLKRIIRCGEAEALVRDAGDPTLRQQIAQCDLLAVTRNKRGELRKLFHRVAPLQPNIKVLSVDNTAGIAAVLERRSLRRGLQFALLLAVVAALFITLGRLNYSLSTSLATFLGTYLQALPFLILGIFLSSVIQVFVPVDLLQRIFPKRLLPGMLFGVLGGFILPICDCASIPVFRSLLRKGVPLPAAVTFMIAAPIINPVVLLSTFYAFGGSVPIMLMRMSFGIVCSVIIGLFFAREKRDVLLAGETARLCACEHTHSHSHSEESHQHSGEGCACGHIHTDAAGGKGKISELLSHFQTEFFEVARFLLIGIGVSTLLQLAMGSQLTNLRISNLAVSMLVMMALAFFLSLCSSSDAVVGKNMGTSLPLGAVMSFMVFGPMIDVKNMILMSASFTKRFMIKLLIVTFAVSFLTVYLAYTLGLKV